MFDQKEYKKKWYLANKERLKLKNKENYINNSSAYKKRAKDWKLQNPERNKELNKKSFIKNIIKRRKYDKEWKKSNRKNVRKWEINWRNKNPDRVRLMDLKCRDRRKRELESNNLNEWTKGSHRHHIDTKNIICIPKELHKSHPHSLKRPKTMNKINILAWNYMEASVL